MPEGCERNTTSGSVQDGLRFEEICGSAAGSKSDGKDGVDSYGARHREKETHIFLPIMLPGLPSAPKNVGLLLSAWLKLTRREARPSRPTIGLLELTCIACAVFSALICSSPFAFGGTNDQPRSFVNQSGGKKGRMTKRTVNLVRLLSITREEPISEHVEAGHA